MHFRCPRCARRHAFPAARMNASGRVPCRCGVTLVLEPPREPRAPAAGVARETADIARLGYTLSVERAAGVFDGLRQAMRLGLGLEDVGRSVPDPARAGRPAMLWPALGLAFEPARFLPATGALLVALSSRWVVRGGGPLGGPGGAALAAVMTALAAAAATTASAVASHDMLASGARLSAWEGVRALARQPAALIGAAR